MFQIGPLISLYELAFEMASKTLFILLNMIFSLIQLILKFLLLTPTHEITRCDQRPVVGRGEKPFIIT